MSRFILAIIFSIVFLFGSAVSYSQTVCVIPNVDTPENTGDSPRVFDWCSNSVHIDNLWQGLHLNEHRDHWLDVFNTDGRNYCNPLGGIARLFNAAWFLGEIYWHRTNDTFPSPPAPPTTNWLAHVVAKSEDGYSYTCNRKQTGTTQGVATNEESGRTWLRPLFFEFSVPLRAAALAHEATHEDEGHVDEDDIPADLKTRCGTSVDRYFPDYNSNTTTIEVLHNAIQTYLKDAESNQLLIRQVNFPGIGFTNMCIYIPLLSHALFVQSLDTIKYKLDCFLENPYLGSFDGIIYGHPYWYCDRVCYPEEYLPGGKSFCNEDYQPGNHDINQHNYSLCTALDDSVSGDATEAARKAARDEFIRNRQQCIGGVSDQYLDRYCSNLIADSGIRNVELLSDAWTIDDEPGIWIPNTEFNECAKRYCEDRFDPAWITDARNACYEWSDTTGCLNHLCGSLNSFAPESMEYFESVQCRRHYIEHNGDSDACFDTLENLGKCENVYAGCVNEIVMEEWLAAKQNNTCSFLEPSGESSTYQIHTLKRLNSIDFDITYDLLQMECPSCKLGACEALLQLCETSRDFNSRVISKFVSVSAIPEKILSKINLPDPPQINIDLSMKQLADYGASPADSVAEFSRRDALRQLTYIPEHAHALSKFLGKDAFFAVYGSSGMEKLFGAATTSFYTNANLQFSFDLNPEQQQLLPELGTHKATRERIESAQIEHVIELVADSELLFDFMADIHQAENVDEVNLLLDGLISILQ
jgi:hypothetical protein